MALTRVGHPTQQLRAPSTATLAALESALSSFRVSPAFPPSTGRRNASHQAQGRANQAKDGPGKRLGAKKGADQYVVPGNILFKQRGTHWFAGDGCFMARDHSIHAKVPGYVKFYRDPALHPKRKYIGVVFERNNPLPQPHNAARKRMLGMLAYQMPPTTTFQPTGDLATMTNNLPPNSSEATDDAAINATVIRERPQEKRKTIKIMRDGKEVKLQLTQRPGGQWRDANWEIGRIGDRSRKLRTMAPHKPGNRWLAWRKRNVQAKKKEERLKLIRSVKAGKGKKGKKPAKKGKA